MARISQEQPSRQNSQSSNHSNGTPPEQISLQASSQHIRYLLIGRPLPLPTNGQPVLSPTVSLLAATYAADGADAARRLWQTTLRHADQALTAAVEGRLARAGDPADIKCTDYGNAERLALRFGHELRYCYPWASWLVWDGRRWQRDSRGEVVRRAKATVQGIYAEAAEAHDRDRRELLAKWALKSEGEHRIKAMLHLAQSEPGIPIVPQELDADPWLLNCLNGTIDLRTGALRAHRQDDLITKLAPVTYDPDATCPQWLQFLQQIFLDRKDLIAFVRRALGYSLTGDVRERVLFIPYGKGRNGKSTLLELMAEMLGDYSLRTPTETLMAKPLGNIPNDLAQLPGRRFVHASESEEGRRLSEALIKDLTGRDTISARFMRGEFFQFQPVCKLWLRTNHKPVIRGTDNAIWDRIRLIPFDLRIPEQDEDHGLPERLRGELAGILAWTVQGCLSWQVNGLGMPDEVKAANASYQAEMDLIGQFLSECCTLMPDRPDVRTQSKVLFEAFCTYAGEAMTQTTFSLRLKERGFTTRSSLGRAYWLGIGLPTTHEAEGKSRVAG